MIDFSVRFSVISLLITSILADGRLPITLIGESLVRIIIDKMCDSQQVKAALAKIISERDSAQKELSIAHQAINELEFQIIEFDRLLANAHRQISLYAPDPTSPSSLPKRWIGTWRSSPQEYPALLCVEEAWRNGHFQQALTFMPALLEREDFGHHHCVNARLLYSSLLQSSAKLPVGLYYAEEALKLASKYCLHELAGKAQFHRGLCYFYLGEPEKARWCFTLASHLEDHVHTIDECKMRAIKQRDALPLDDLKRSISADFKFFPHFETEDPVSQFCAPKSPGNV